MRLILPLILMTGCASVLPPPVEITKARWMECWAICGKKDRLISVTERECACKDGKRIQTGPLPEDSPESGWLHQLHTPFEFLIPE